MSHRPTVYVVIVEDELVEIFMTEGLAIKWLRSMKFVKSSTYPTLWHRNTERAYLQERPINVKEFVNARS